jgi:GDP-4-dehydro-6-deoxy-D-mannose reductase
VRVLITGVAGFAGSHLAEYCLGLPDVELYGLYRHRSSLENLQDLRRSGKLAFIGENSSVTTPGEWAKLIDQRNEAGKLNMLEGDVTDAFSMERLIGGLKPERIFHLAAQSYVPGSWNAPVATLEINVIGQVNLFEAVRKTGVDCAIQIAGSSEEYGLVQPDETPIKETNPLRPLSPYAVSKIAQENLAYQYHRSFGMRTVVTRGFNHEGPRRGHVFVTSSRALQIAEIEKGLKPPVIYVGDMSSVRDWTDVRDMVRAYWLALEKGTPGEVYNVGTGVGRTVGQMQDLLLGMSAKQIEVKVDPARMRPSDVKLLVADASKFRAATGWAPQVPFEQTMGDLLEYWRRQV